MEKIRKESTGRHRIDPKGEKTVTINATIFISQRDWVEKFENKSEKIREALTKLMLEEL